MFETVELGYSDPSEGLLQGTQPPRPPQLAFLLRALLERRIDHWSITPGQPLQPAQIHEVIMERLAGMGLTDRESTATVTASRSKPCSD